MYMCCSRPSRSLLACPFRGRFSFSFSFLFCLHFSFLFIFIELSFRHLLQLLFIPLSRTAVLFVRSSLPIQFNPTLDIDAPNFAVLVLFFFVSHSSSSSKPIQSGSLRLSCFFHFVCSHLHTALSSLVSVPSTYRFFRSVLRHLRCFASSHPCLFFHLSMSISIFMLIVSYFFPLTFFSHSHSSSLSLSLSLLCVIVSHTVAPALRPSLSPAGPVPTISPPDIHTY